MFKTFSRFLFTRKHYMVFDEINLITLPISLSFLVSGFEVYYVRLSGFLKRDIIFDILKNIGIHLLNDTNANCVTQIYFEETSRQVKLIFSDMLNEGELGNCLEKYYNKVNDGIDIKKKLESAQFELINTKINTYVHLICLAESEIRGKNKGNYKIYIFAKNNIFTRFVLKRMDCNCINMCPSSLTIIFDLIGLINKVISKCLQKIKSSPLKKDKNNSQKGNAEKNNLEEYKILYFPHQGIYYGKLPAPLFIKDQYYNSNPENPFYKTKILHISLGDMRDNEEAYRETYLYYEKNKIPYCDLFDFHKIGLYSLITLFIKFLSTFRFNIFREIIHHGFYILFCYFHLFCRIEIFLRLLSTFKKAKIAFAGYDFNFPRALSIALSLRKIKTVAIQDRAIMPYYPGRRMIFDYYFVSGQAVKERIERTDKQGIGHVIISGLPRSDLIRKYSKDKLDEKYLKIKEKYFLVFALDYWSARTRLNNYSVVFGSWNNNKKFYKDLIRLAIALPEIYIAIKGKDTESYDIEEYKDILDIMDFLPNISIEKDLKTYSAYKMGAMSDAVVALYTSFVEEYLSTGKPLLIYNFVKYPIFHFDFNDFPCIVNNYEELYEGMSRIVKDNEYMDEDQIDKFRNSFASNKYCGKIREYIQKELLTIYDNCSKEI